MKKLFTTLFLACLFFVGHGQNNVGIGTSTPDNSALLDLSTTSKGLLVPRLSTTQKLTIPNPATGLLVYDIITSSFWYFNGTIWVEITFSSQGTNGFLHYIGELYGGGIIVSVWKEAGYEHGLIASLTDIDTTSIWSNISTTLIGASAQSPTDGQANTNAIIAQPGHISSAALVCDSYSAGGFNDWYLPAVWELNQCYNAALIVNTILGIQNGFQFASACYWSSTESNSSRAWVQYFTSGIIGSSEVKTSTFRVRAVRRF